MKLPSAGVALAVVLAVGCASGRAAQPAELYERARAILSSVEDAPRLGANVHDDSRVLEALGVFLQAADAEGLEPTGNSPRLRGMFSDPPWDWFPTIEFRQVAPGLHLVALSEAVSGTPSSLYLFDHGRHVGIDSGLGIVQVEKVFVTGDRIEVAYVPSSSSSAPRLTSVQLEKRGGVWRVDRDTVYRRVMSLLAQVPRSEMKDAGVHRNPRLLEAFGLFLAHADRLSQEELHDHMFGLFSVEWHQGWPTFDIRRIGPALYLVTIDNRGSDTSNGSLYLFDGASHVSLASDDTHGIVVEETAVQDRRVEVTYRRSAAAAPDRREAVVAEPEGGVWRVVSRR